jgi:hypothetical protein
MPDDAERSAAFAAPSIPEREPNLMRFGLRQLFSFISLATILVALLAHLGGVWPILLGAAIALVSAHVLGTFVGTRLRDTSSEVQRWKGRPGSADRDEPVAPPQPVRVADLALPAPSLASHEDLGQWRHWCVAVGAIGGLFLGGAGIYTAAGDDVTAPGIAMGSLSGGVIGAWMTLLGTNFCAIVRQTLRQAGRELGRDQLRD